jgi:outer membrane protein assembly factor BamB
LVAGGAVYAIVRADYGGGLIKVDAKTGSPSSSWPSDPVMPVGGRLNWCAPAFSDGKLFVVDSSQVYKIDAVDGRIEAWTLPLGQIDDELYASPVVSDGVVFIGTSDAGFFAYDTTSMHRKWKWPPTPVPNIPAVQCSPAVTKDHVYFTTDETILYALDVKDGTEEWKVRVHSGRTTCWPPAVANGVVYLATDDTLYAYDAAKGLRNGKPLLAWQYVHQGSARSFTGPPVVANGFVYVTMDISGSVLMALAVPTWPYKK